MAELTAHQDRERNLRMSRNLIAEHDFIENHGSRITRWESVIDHVNKRRVYANIDTLEIIHKNSAICEKCDYIFEQSDEKCSKCESLRSSKNGKLYRPFGFQNICVDWKKKFPRKYFNSEGPHIWGAVHFRLSVSVDHPVARRGPMGRSPLFGQYFFGPQNLIFYRLDLITENTNCTVHGGNIVNNMNM